MAASGVSGGSESDPGAIAPDDGGTGGDVGTGAGVADAAETSAEQDENSQETAGDTVSGGVNLSGLIGRYKHSWSITAGSSDGTSSLDIPFSGGTTSGGIFTVTLASNLTFPIPSAPGSLSFTGAGTESPFGLINGTSTLFPGSQFVLVEAFENSFPTDRIIGFAGTTTTTFPTTGATFYNYRRDFQLDSNVPFVFKASGGDILADPTLSSSAEASATIYWNNSGSGSHRPFGFATGGVVGTQTSQKSVVSLIIGEVITATVDGVTRTFIAGEPRASSRVSSSQAPHIIEGDASTAFGDTYLNFSTSTGTSPDTRNGLQSRGNLCCAEVAAAPGSRKGAGLDPVLFCRRVSSRFRYVCRFFGQMNDESGSLRNSISSAVLSRRRISLRCGNRPKRSIISRWRPENLILRGFSS